LGVGASATYRFLNSFCALASEYDAFEALEFTNCLLDAWLQFRESLLHQKCYTTRMKKRVEIKALTAPKNIPGASWNAPDMALEHPGTAPGRPEIMRGHDYSHVSERPEDSLVIYAEDTSAYCWGTTNSDRDLFRPLTCYRNLTKVDVSYERPFLVSVNVGAGIVNFSISERAFRLIKEASDHLFSHQTFSFEATVSDPVLAKQPFLERRRWNSLTS
jgi:hypothetical protein